MKTDLSNFPKDIRSHKDGSPSTSDIYRYKKWKEDFEASLRSRFSQIANDIFEDASLHVYVGYENTPYLNDKDELVQEIIKRLKKEILGDG